VSNAQPRCQYYGWRPSLQLESKNTVNALLTPGGTMLAANVHEMCPTLLPATHQCRPESWAAGESACRPGSVRPR